MQSTSPEDEGREIPVGVGLRRRGQQLGERDHRLVPGIVAQIALRHAVARLGRFGCWRLRRQQVGQFAPRGVTITDELAPTGRRKLSIRRAREGGVLGEPLVGCTVGCAAGVLVGCTVGCAACVLVDCTVGCVAVCWWAARSAARAMCWWAARLAARSTCWRRPARPCFPAPARLSRSAAPARGQRWDCTQPAAEHRSAAR